MTTIDDQATEREERDRAEALKYRKPELSHGYCHNCFIPAPGASFCGAECQQDYEQRERFIR